MPTCGKIDVPNMIDRTKFKHVSMTEDEIESHLDKIITGLDPKIRSRFGYNFSYEKGNELARCMRMFKPNLITFCIKTIADAPDLCPELLEELVNHEVLHTFYGFEERAAIGGMDIVNFKKKNGDN